MKRLLLILLAIASLAGYNLPTLMPEPMHQGQSLRAWLAQLQAPQPDARAEAALALCRIHANRCPNSAVIAKALTNALADKSVRVQQIALVGLFRIAQDNRSAVRPALPALCQVLQGEDAVNRSHAAQLLGVLGSDPKVVVPLLTKALADSSYLVRTAAAQALAQIGPSANAAVPALVEALRDSENLVCLSAELALKAIDPETAARVGVR